MLNPGEEFEINCFNYLTNTYGNKFHREGGMDSTKSDILVINNNCINYYIEVKDTNAQSGQFVLLPNEDNNTFVFSPRNHSKPNEMTDIIINYMNQHFDLFNKAGTAGKSLNIDDSVFVKWIINHYINKNVKYIISCYNDKYVIFPIRKFASYFDISAKYRIKKSGSGAPAKKDISTVTDVISKTYQTAKFTVDGKKLFVTITEPILEDKFVLGKYTYYFSRKEPKTYEVRRLSNTYNMNVIFSIKTKQSQDDNDLKEFISDL